MKAKGLSMLLRDVDPDVAAHLPPEFVTDLCMNI